MTTNLNMQTMKTMLILGGIILVVIIIVMWYMKKEKFEQYVGCHLLSGSKKSTCNEYIDCVVTSVKAGDSVDVAKGKCEAVFRQNTKKWCRQHLPNPTEERVTMCARRMHIPSIPPELYTK